MTTDEIEVGQLYFHERDQMPRQIYLGVGMRKLWSEPREFTEKHLVVFYSPDRASVGLMVQEGENVHPGYWDYFRPLSAEAARHVVQGQEPTPTVTEANGEN